jgi:prevent-host-death family protein
MVTYSHHVVMKNANVSELKAHLSAYLAKVRKGETVIVCDRSTPIARLVPYESDPTGLAILAPSRPRSELRKVRPVRPRRPVDVVELLREDREQR